MPMFSTLKPLLINVLIFALLSGNKCFISAENTILEQDAYDVYKFAPIIVDPKSLGGDFLLTPGSALSFTYTGMNKAQAFPDGSIYSYLFSRFVEDKEKGDFYGLWAYIYKNGRIRISYRYNSEQDEDEFVIATPPGILPPKSTESVRVTVGMKPNGLITLKVGEEVFEGVIPSDQAALVPKNVKGLSTSPLIFGGSADALQKNLYATITDVVLKKPPKKGIVVLKKTSTFMYKAVWKLEDEVQEDIMIL